MDTKHTGTRLVLMDRNETGRSGCLGFTDPTGPIAGAAEFDPNGLWSTPDQADAMARYAAAAFNACMDAGISTEALEAGVVGEMRDVLGKMPAHFDMQARFANAPWVKCEGKRIPKYTAIANECEAGAKATAAVLSKLEAPTYACSECGKADDKPECDCREDNTNG